MDSIEKFIISVKLAVADAMVRIDENSNGIVFVTDSNGVLKGCITDGDIRRFLLSGGNMSASVSEVMNRNPIVANSVEDAAQFYHVRNCRAIPIIDSGRVIDVYCGEKEQNNKELREQLHVPIVINAGGKGTRLDPFTKVLPKPLIPIGERPIIELIMQEYESYGCDDFRIIVNYKKDLIKAYFADEEKKHKITWFDEQLPLGTGGGLSLLKGELKDTFFFANCDALLTADYNDILKFHRDNGNTITMICANKSVHIPYGIVETGEGGVIRCIKEKPSMSMLTNTGIYVVEPEVVYDIKDNECISFPDVAMREKQKGKKVAVFAVDEKEWMDMGQMPELEKMRVKLFGE